MVRWYFTITALKTLLEAAGGSWNADWIRDRKERHRLQCELALQEFEAWLQRISLQPASAAP